ncbi:MAG: hypothetical protein U0746_05660 [Gemmataceae bacterium]
MRPFAFVAFLVSASTFADEAPCVSGLKLGQRPGPYSFQIATGPERGTTMCYVCETADKPAAIVFARTLSEPLGKLTAKLDQAIGDKRVPELRGWLTMLSDAKQTDTETKLVDWGRKHAIKVMPLGAFEDLVGPPSYRLAREADVTVLLFVKQKVVANFAFRTGELTDARIDEVAKGMEKLK